MERSKVEERQASVRIPTSLRGRYFIKDERQEGGDCTVINISLNGTGLAFYSPETVKQGAKLSLKMFALEGTTTVTVDGVVSWVKQGKKDTLCGLQLLDVLDNTKQLVLGLC